MGDFNVIMTELDVYKPERWVKDALFLPEVRKAFANLLAQGWTDAIRKLYPDDVIYTFWDYFRNAYTRNAGLLTIAKRCQLKTIGAFFYYYWLIRLTSFIILKLFILKFAKI